jgi:hypothetical protein
MNRDKPCDQLSRALIKGAKKQRIKQNMAIFRIQLVDESRTVFGSQFLFDVQANNNTHQVN